jgi:hypothetical protein
MHRSNYLPVAWIRRLLSSEGLLKESLSVGQGIRSLIQTFLDARTRAMPEPAAPIDDSQESQEGYADMELDEDALAAFDAFEANCNVGNDKDDAVVEVRQLSMSWKVVLTPYSGAGQRGFICTPQVHLSEHVA